LTRKLNQNEATVFILRTIQTSYFSILTEKKLKKNKKQCFHFSLLFSFFFLRLFKYDFEINNQYIILTLKVIV
jgi:hypothetical protein